MNLVSILLAAVMCAAAGPGMGVHSEAEPPDWLEPGYVAPVEEDNEESEEPEDTSFTIDLSVVGDCMLATHKGGYYNGSFSWYAAHKDPSYFFEKVYDIFSADDFTIVNLENVLTDRKLAEVNKGVPRAFWFKGPASNANILTAGSVEAVSLANNHTGDYGSQGRADTIAAVKEAGLDYGTNDKTIYLEKNGFVIAVICHGLWNEAQASDIVRRVKAASEKSDYQIVFYHGGAESVHKPEDWRVRFAQAPAVTHEERLALEALLEALSDQERQVVALHAIAGLKHREIAQLLSLPLSTVLSRYHRALNKLKLTLKEENNHA